MSRLLLFLTLAAFGASAQEPDILEGRKRANELLKRTYAQCGKNKYRLAEDRSGPGGSQQFRIAEYEGLSHLLNVLESEPKDEGGIQYRAAVEHSCTRKRIYTLSRAGSEWRGQWSDWVPCGNLDPENPLVLKPGKRGAATEIVKRKGAWSLAGAPHNTDPKSMTCEDVPPAGGDLNAWMRGFLMRRGVR